MYPEMKAVLNVRTLGADVTEEMEAYLKAKRERRMLEAAVDLVFVAKGWR